MASAAIPEIPAGLPFREEERLPSPLFLCKPQRNRYARFNYPEDV